MEVQDFNIIIALANNEISALKYGKTSQVYYFEHPQPSICTPSVT